MRPQESTKSQSQSARDLSVPERDAAANVVRGQIDALYEGRTAKPAPQAAPVSHANTSHHKTKQPAATQQPDQWQQYHNAWQEYYQKYYERYYTGHVQRVLAEQQNQAGQQAQAAASTDSRGEHTPDEPSKPEGKKEALDQLRQKLRSNVHTSAKKVRKSRHFIPITAAVVVVMIFAFLQYNSLLIGNVQAYVSPGTIDPQNIVVDPTSDVKVGPDPKLIIPKINVDVPVIYNVASTHDAQMAAMAKGAAHFAIPGADSVPGQVGNAVFAGHSSNDIFGAGDYKFMFAQLEKLQAGDTIFVNYQGIRYTYTITKTEVVKPTDVQKLVYPTDKPMLTLITCTPIGTAISRLLVTAEQVSPDPAKAAAAATNTTSGDANMPGNSPSALERLFGSNG
jgi:sortase A